MDSTIRNLDEAAYRALKARAALEGRAIGELVSDAMRLYLTRPAPQERTGTLQSIRPLDRPAS